MISAEELVGEEQAECYSLTPMERWRESAKLWEMFLSMGGSLDPEPDTQSPFFDREAPFSPCRWAGQACVLYGAAEFSRLAPTGLAPSS